jgi:hypothetical protein
MNEFGKPSPEETWNPEAHQDTIEKAEDTADYSERPIKTVEEAIGSVWEPLSDTARELRKLSEEPTGATKERLQDLSAYVQRILFYLGWAVASKQNREKQGWGLPTFEAYWERDQRLAKNR